MDFVLIPIGNGQAKRLPIPLSVTKEGDAAIDAYVAHPPEKELAKAETVPYPAPAPVEKAPAAAKEK